MRRPSFSFRRRALAALLVGVASVATPLAVGPASAAPASAGAIAPPPVDALGEIPIEVLVSYRAAAVRHHLPWTVLAGLGRVATDHGRRSPDDDVARTSWPQPEPAIAGPSGVGPLLLDPARLPELDPARLQSWPVSLEVVASALSEAVTAVASERGLTRAQVDATPELSVVAPVWSEALGRLPLAAGGGLCEARPQEAGAALVRVVFGCAVARAEVQAAGPTGALLDVAAGRAALVERAVALAWDASRWGAEPCDPDADVAGIVALAPVEGLDRCDPGAALAHAAAAVVAGEVVPSDQRSDPQGGLAALVDVPARLEPAPTATTPDVRPARRVLEHAARYRSGVLGSDAEVVAAARAAGVERAQAWGALATWRTARLTQPGCGLGLGAVHALASGAGELPAAWVPAVVDGDLDGRSDPADRDDRVATVLVQLCGSTGGWSDPEARRAAAALVVGDSAVDAVLAQAELVDAAVAPTLQGAQLAPAGEAVRIPGIGRLSIARPELPSAGTPPTADEPDEPGEGDTVSFEVSLGPVPEPVPVPDPGVAEVEQAPGTPSAPAAVPEPDSGPSDGAGDAPADSGEAAYDLDAAIAALSDLPTPVALAAVRGITVGEHVAPYLEAMLAAAEADGLVLRGGGYRTTASQLSLRAAHCGPTEHDVWDKASGACSPPTATPGRSRHETGEAVDFSSCGTRATACYRWLAAHAHEFGFFNQPAEAWHWSIDGG